MPDDQVAKKPKKKRSKRKKGSRARRPSKHNYADLKRRYMDYEWLTYEDMASKLQMSISTIRKMATEEEESWIEERSRVERESQALRKEHLRHKLPQEFMRRLDQNLGVAALAKQKGAEGLRREGLVLDPDQSLRAIDLGTEIEQRVLVRPMVKQVMEEEAKDDRPNVNMTAIEQLVVLVQGSGQQAQAGLVQALQKKLSNGG